MGKVTKYEVNEAVEKIGGTEVKQALAIGGNDGAGNFQAAKVSATGDLSVSLGTADIEIGAVELKDASTDVRAEVTDANSGNTTGTHVLKVQSVDAEGHSPDWSDLDDTRVATQAAATSLAAMDNVVGTHDSAAPTEANMVGLLATNADITNVGNGDIVRGVATLDGKTIIAGYDRANNTNRFVDSNPARLAGERIDFEDTTNKAIGTYNKPSANGADLLGFPGGFTLTGKIIADAATTVAITVEVMNDEDLTLGDWIDITLQGDDCKTGIKTTGISINNGTLTFAIMYKVAFARARITYDVSGGAVNTIIIKGWEVA